MSRIRVFNYKHKHAHLTHIDNDTFTLVFDNKSLITHGEEDRPSRASFSIVV